MSSNGVYSNHEVQESNESLFSNTNNNANNNTYNNNYNNAYNHTHAHSLQSTPPKKKRVPSSSNTLTQSKINSIYSSSQVNPNYSSSNLSKVNHITHSSNPYSSHHGSTVSLVSTPIMENAPTFGSNSLNSSPSFFSTGKFPSSSLPPTAAGVSGLNGVGSLGSLGSLGGLGGAATAAGAAGGAGATGATGAGGAFPLSPPISESTSPELQPGFEFEYGQDLKLNDGFSNQVKGNYIIQKLVNLIPPINFKICSLCFVWYFCSIISSNSIKLVLTNFKYPVTVTEIQFLLIAILSLIALWLSRLFRLNIPSEIFPSGKSVRQFVRPTKEILSATLPMGGFQFVGHLTSHKATSLIPVSLVHTIKALSPIVTVLVFRFMFRKEYKMRTYLTLIPLVVGIMMTCYKPSNKSKIIPTGGDSMSSAYSTGLVFAFISMLIFVSQNIFAKDKLATPKEQPTVVPTTTVLNKQKKKLDNLTILFYCSLVGFTFTFPVYVTSELFSPKFSLAQLDTSILGLILINGVSHFTQSILAFQILRLLSPIDYSIANILKRIFIILISFIWELKNFTTLQSFGLVTTLLGLYCYDRWGTQREKTV
ncbi:hypothetical protein PVL30_005364 [Lodderomyces elongisporus]|uniref:uncharacterized protein n=1 Tax=Lodderomyces elongisporus TaxID=36914 RepID=UPI00291CD760|nr:uncharacterized protein PVL30_005364 [Lodderomyces elongisporus]WLF81565.1 hypothetical protein PVL30_005364 [Lodderomyces elongisporus]